MIENRIVLLGFAVLVVSALLSIFVLVAASTYTAAALILVKNWVIKCPSSTEGKTDV